MSRASFGGAISRQPDLATQSPLDVRGDPLTAPQFVVVSLEGARNEDRVEREAVGRREDLRVDDVAAGRGAQAPAMPVSSLGWSGATTVTAVTPRRLSIVTSVASERMSAAMACSSLAWAT